MSTDSNLLFGILALQADFINRDQFVEGCAAWASRKSAPLGDLLVERGWLNPADRAAVQRLVQKKLDKHGGDVHASLAAVADEGVRQSLAAVNDGDIHHSLAGLQRPGGLPQSPTLTGTVAYTPESRDRYTVTRLHAKGGIGQVWLARDHGLGREVALKDLRPEKSVDPALAARFIEEAQITGQLEHPNIVPVYELARRPDDQRPYYTMRFVRGRTLGAAIKAFHERRQSERFAPLEFRELLNAFTDVCHAVAYAHSRGVIHRDLKPQNVVVGDFGEVVLLDWGLAKLVGRPEREAEAPPVVVERFGEVDLTVHGQVLGTPAYMAPEQADGRLDQIEPRTDVYGLGAMLYEILTGKPPFAGENTAAVLERVRKADPEPPRRCWSRVPRPLVAICAKAMAKAQADRYPSVTALGRDVQRWLGNEAVNAYEEPFSERAGRWMRRHQALTAAAVTLLLATVATLGAGLWVLNQSKDAIDEQRKKAESNLSHSLNTMAQSLQTLETQMERAPVPGMQPFQKQMLKQQLDRYDWFPAHYRERGNIQILIASANYRLGKVSQDIGTLPEALSALVKARDFYEAANAQEDSSTLYHDRLARCYFSIGQVHLLVGDPAAALEPLRKAIALSDGLLTPLLEAYRREREKLLAKGDTTQQTYTQSTGRLWLHHEVLAWQHSYLALAERRTGRVDEALRSFARAQEHFNELIKEENRSIDVYPFFPNGFGFCLLHQAQLEQELGRAAPATGTYQTALVHLRRALTLQREKAEPSNKALAQFHGVLALALNHYGTHLAEGDHPAEATAAYDEAITLLKDLHRDNPALLPTQARLALAQANRGYLLLQTGKLDPAEASFRSALEVAERLANGTPSPDPTSASVGNPELMDGKAAAVVALRGLGLVLQKRGRNPEALAALRRALSLGPKVAQHAPVHRYQLAGAQALASALTEDKEEQRRLADQALDALRQAIQLGYRNAAWIERDPALEPLRARPEFQQILAEWKK